MHKSMNELVWLYKELTNGNEISYNFSSSKDKVGGEDHQVDNVLLSLVKYRLCH